MIEGIKDVLTLGTVYPISNSARTLYFEQIYFSDTWWTKGQNSKIPQPEMYLWQICKDENYVNSCALQKPILKKITNAFIVVFGFKI